MAADKPVTGQMAVTLMDEMKSIYGIMPEPNRVIFSVIAILGLGAIVVAVGVPIGNIRLAFGLLGGVLVLFTLFLPVRSTIRYLASSIEQRQLYVAVDSGKIEKRSGTGFVIAVPWSDVRWCRENNLGFAFSVRPMAVIWLPKKVFAASAVHALRRLIRDKIGRQARLRENGDGP